eukprot:3126274-Amphidinium_carterae.1
MKQVNKRGNWRWKCCSGMGTRRESSPCKYNLSMARSLNDIHYIFPIKGGGNKENKENDNFTRTKTSTSV